MIVDIKTMDLRQEFESDNNNLNLKLKATGGYVDNETANLWMQYLKARLNGTYAPINELKRNNDGK